MQRFKTTRRVQKGQAAIELVFSILMFVAMLGSLLSLSVYMYLNHTFLTAAKEGARAASLETKLASSTTQSQGITNVRNWVKTFMTSSAGLTLADNDISVTGPTGSTIGSRTVQVVVSHTYQSPIQIRTFMNRLAGGSDPGLDTITISNTATMRYEE